MAESDVAFTITLPDDRGQIIVHTTGEVSLPDDLDISEAAQQFWAALRQAVFTDPPPQQGMTASEAVYAFAAWLTTRDEPITLSARHEASQAAMLVQQFLDANHLPAPREGWGCRQPT